MSLPPIKPIETHYNGYRFRSRLEARWAVFFDTLGIKYRYEYKGWDLGDGIWYLPDFWLEEYNAWLEIKPVWPPTKEETEKSLRVCLGTGQPVYLLTGDVWPNAYKCVRYTYLPSIRTEENIKKIAKSLQEEVEDPLYTSTTRDSNYWRSPTQYVGYYSPSNFVTFDFQKGWQGDAITIGHCAKCKRTFFPWWEQAHAHFATEYGPLSDRPSCDGKEKGDEASSPALSPFVEPPPPLVWKAFILAREARFGKNGRG